MEKLDILRANSENHTSPGGNVASQTISSRLEFNLGLFSSPTANEFLEKIISKVESHVRSLYLSDMEDSEKHRVQCRQALIEMENFARDMYSQEGKTPRATLGYASILKKVAVVYADVLGQRVVAALNYDRANSLLTKMSTTYKRYINLYQVRGEVYQAQAKLYKGKIKEKYEKKARLDFIIVINLAKAKKKQKLLHAESAESKG